MTDEHYRRYKIYHCLYMRDYMPLRYESNDALKKDKSNIMNLENLTKLR